ncbi:hypothetical protein K438DRAFT_104394 [Mycena galopus ATCC 62051]|nr:hypothetical protein K438DRAFT_104394 [Mycena galopus ATCC 62051]
MLTRISSRWRATSLSTPSLWSRVYVDGDDLCPVPMIEAHIQRARNLKIRFVGSETAKAQSQVRIFQLLSQHSSRWEELDLLLPVTSPIIPLLTALRDQLCSLKRVWLQWLDDEIESPTVVHHIDCFQSAPSLVEFGISSEFPFATISLPVHQFTRLDLDGAWQIHCDMFKAASNLVEAHIVITSDDEPWPEVRSPFELLHLRRLYVSHAEALGYFKTPALKEVGLEVHAGDGVEDIFNPSLIARRVLCEGLVSRAVPMPMPLHRYSES